MLETVYNRVQSQMPQYWSWEAWTSCTKSCNWQFVQMNILTWWVMQSDLLETILSLRAQWWLLLLNAQIPTGLVTRGVSSRQVRCGWSYAKMTHYIFYWLACSKDFSGKIAASIQKRNTVTWNFCNYLVSHLITLFHKVTCLHTADLVFWHL